jgi:hypothetical protein
MKLKYNKQTGDIICMGSMPSLSANNDNEEVKTVSFDFPSEPLSYFTFNGNSLVRKNQTDIDNLVNYKNFDPERAIAREAQVYTPEELVRLMPYSYTLNEMIRFKNFWGGANYTGLNQVGLALISIGAILQSDYDKLAGILLEQGIVLNQ